MDAGPLAMDAAMGTRLIGLGLDLRSDDPCLWNLDRPDDVLEVHRRDVTAGARVLLTNTFGANGFNLEQKGQASDLEPINREAVALARRAVGPSGFVLGEIGPLAIVRPGAAREQAMILADAGVDALILSTFEFPAAVLALKQVRAGLDRGVMPVFVSLWKWPDAVEDAARGLLDASADVIGLNCRPALHEAVGLVRRLHRAVGCPLLVKPGVDPADPPEDATPSAFSAAVPALLDGHVRLIGGCCGTTEAHVDAIATAMASSVHPTTSPHPGATP
jgi:methionine synthase I (cobalamin-dependent)